MICPQHGDGCRWYAGSEQQGADLGYGDGWGNARDFAAEHEAMHLDVTPVPECRGDLFAIGWFDGLVAAWCVVCPRPMAPGNRCLARHAHRKALADSLS